MAVLNVISKPFAKVFGSRNDRLVKRYEKRVEQVNAREAEVRQLTDAELRQRTEQFRQMIAEGASPQSILDQALAVMRESMDRNVGIRNLFNPVYADQFDPSALPDEARQAYEQVKAEIDNTPAIEVLGSEQPVPGWLQVDIPNVLYEAVRQIYPLSKPPFRARPFDVQIIGGIVLYEGKIAEMKTGEGKTIVAPLACYMAVLEGLQCHVITVNDYLVQRDRDWVFPAFHRLGITSGAIHPFHMQPPHLKQRAYQCDIVYGTNSEFGFDYLRDNMKLSTDEQVQRKRDFCIVDEVDSILIDEARTPLIISGPAHDDAPQYVQANNVAEQLVARQRAANQETRQRISRPGFAAAQARQWRVPESAIQAIIAKFRDLGPDFLDEKEADQIGHTQYYVVKKESKQASMTAQGVEEAQKLVGTRFYVVGNDMGWDHLINNALRAHAVYERDRDYVTKDGEVVIVDEFTGRLMIGRQWSDGLHQAVEAKEARNGVRIKEETQTLATITIQNFLKLYGRLAGMTGTAVTEATEFMEIYKLDVVCIPTNEPVIRIDYNDLIFLTEKAKWKAIIAEIKQTSEAGRPVLVGTTSVEKSQILSEMLTKKSGVEHEVLNAKQHEREAHIVAKAGQSHKDKRGRTMGNVTISTNMAGRGTDIRLSDDVLKAGGLHIVGTERHESRRIDNQLRGRAGRQGDPGSSRFFISMEDDLMKMFAGAMTMKALSRLGMKEDDAIEHRWITRSVERAQTKVEQRNYEIRKNLLEYDEVMEYQRHSFYGVRQEVLEGRGIKALIFKYLAESVEDAVERFLDRDYPARQAAEAVRSLFHANIDYKKLRSASLDDVAGRIRSDAKAEVRQDIENSLGEYMSGDVPREDWDFKGMKSWAMSRFNVDLKQAYLREAEPEAVAERLSEAASALIDRRSLDALGKYYQPGYAQRELAEWIKQKFDFEMPIEQLMPGKSESEQAYQQRVAEEIFQKAQAAYKQREVEYPVQFILETVINAAQQGAEGTTWAADQLAAWANRHFDLHWTDQSVREMSGEQVHQTLLAEAKAWRGEKLDRFLDTLCDSSLSHAQRVGRFKERFGVELDIAELEAAEDVRDYLREQVLDILREELTQLERFVLLQILDQGWKDHLYAMDQLKDAIGLRGFGEQDPKIEYKREGARMFTELQRSMRDKVTDLVFRARLTANVQMRNAYGESQQAHHATRESTGVSADELAVGGTAEQRADLAAANRAGSEGQVTATIKRDQPRIGRNTVITIENTTTGERRQIKFKKAERMLAEGWKLVN